MLLALFPSLGPVEVLLALSFCALVIWPSCRICAKAGFPWALGLFAAVPGLNLVLLLVLAFAEWPALRRGDR